MERLHLDLCIRGTVQGVWYRKSAMREAIALGVCGYAMNLVDGPVVIAAEGAREALDRFVAWCRVGPPHAVVTSVEVTEGPWVGYVAFEIRR